VPLTDANVFEIFAANAFMLWLNLFGYSVKYLCRIGFYAEHAYGSARNFEDCLCFC